MKDAFFVAMVGEGVAFRVQDFNLVSVQPGIVAKFT
jgi:hypothetical protein